MSISKRTLPFFAGALLLAAAGCAKAPSTMGTGARLVVTLQFKGPVNPNYQYFFLIRNANDSSARNGPVAILDPIAGNGFATDLHPAESTAAFTDFVAFGYGRALGASGYGVYHVPNGIAGNPNLGTFVPHGEPEAVTAPSTQNPNTLQFELALSRLTTNLATGETDPNDGATPRYLQVNVVATTSTPADPQSADPSRLVDAFGDQHTRTNTILTVDAALTGHTYISSTTPSDPFYEPDDDTYPAQNDPGIELTGWSIQVTNR